MARKRRETSPAPPGLSGPVVYCPVCLHAIGVYKAAGKRGGGPVAGPVCGGCQRRQRDDARKGRPTKGTSVHTVSGGLPTLGKGRK